MGLAERRAAKEFEDRMFPALKERVDKAAGFEVIMDVQWQTLAKQEYAHLYGECFPKIYFTPLIDALKSITKDNLGKEALKKGLKRVVVKNVSGNYYGSGFTFDDGVLTLDHDFANADSVEERRDAIQKLLENAL